MKQSINNVNQFTVKVFAMSLLLAQTMSLFGMEETPQSLQLIFSGYPKGDNNFANKYYVRSITFTLKQDKNDESNIIRVNNVKRKNNVSSNDTLTLKVHCGETNVILCRCNDEIKCVCENKIKCKTYSNSKYHTIDLTVFVLPLGNKEHPNNISFNDDTLYKVSISRFAPVIISRRLSDGGYKPENYLIQNGRGNPFKVKIEKYRKMKNKPTRQYVHTITCKSGYDGENDTDETTFNIVHTSTTMTGRHKDEIGIVEGPKAIHLLINHDKRSLQIATQKPIENK